MIKALLSNGYKGNLKWWYSKNNNLDVTQSSKVIWIAARHIMVTIVLLGNYTHHSFTCIYSYFNRK